MPILSFLPPRPVVTGRGPLCTTSVLQSVRALLPLHWQTHHPRPWWPAGSSLSGGPAHDRSDPLSRMTATAPGSTSTLMGALSTPPRDRRGEPTLVEPALAPPGLRPETRGRFQIEAAPPVVQEGS